MPVHPDDTRIDRRRSRLRDLTSRLLRRWHRHPLSEPAAPHEAADHALLLVDVQNDFISGALPMNGAVRIISTLNRYLELFAARDLPVYLARDWHPPESTHFSTGGAVLPAHCVRGTPGAAFPNDLQIPVGAVLISKGTQTGEQAFSAFSGHHPGPVSLGKCLETRGVRTLYVAGLGAGVPATVLDAAQMHFDVVLLVDAVRGLDGTSARLRRSIDEMCRAGARVAQFDDVTHELGLARPSATAASSLP